MTEFDNVDMSELSEESVPHVNSQDSPYSPLYNPRKNKGSKNILTAVLLCILVLFLIIGLIIALSQIVKPIIQELKTSHVFNGGLKTEMAQEEDYLPDENDIYYDHLVDAIDNSLSYSVEKEEYNYSDVDKNVDIHIDYVQIKDSDIDKQDSINSYIEDSALFFLKNYAAHPENGNVEECMINIKSYVTYMSEDVMSVVLDEKVNIQGILYLDLICINIDIPSGQILDNSNMITFSEELGKEFKKISNRQNGDVEVVDLFSNQEIADLIQSSDSGIIFYSPVGLELGFNYSYGDVCGWVTATFNDYKKWIKKI